MLQCAVEHSSKEYQCERSPCTYTGTTIIEKRDWRTGNIMRVATGIGKTAYSNAPTRIIIIGVHEQLVVNLMGQRSKGEVFADVLASTF